MNISPQAQGGDAQSSPVSKVRALIVDDHADAAKMLQMMLGTFGCETAVATNGIEALRMANETKPRLILLDIRMPKLDGYDTCGVIRAQPWGKDVGIIAITGEAQSIQQSAETKGFDSYLLKPIELADLEKAIRPYLA